jgi:exonuclease III
VRLLTWNLNGRRRIDGQIAFIASRAPDVVTLQEVTGRSAALFRQELLQCGFAHVVDSFTASTPWVAAGPRRYGLLIASRHPLAAQPSSLAVPWPERLLSADIAIPHRSLTIHTTHIPPGSSNGWMKVKMLEAVAQVVAESPPPLILCGDFNTPQAETLDGKIVTWGERWIAGKPPRVQARKRGGPGDRWDAAERTILEGGRDSALIDAFRALHGYERQDFSWFVRRGELRIGRRFDHVFCSRDIRLRRCEYLHDVRENGLSDHSAMEVEFEL